ncbi:MAG TPA: APC family permease [Caulobacteraceae bacterium]|jgi:amino acid transporter
MTTQPDTDGRAALRRGLGRWDLTALLVNLVIGAGVLGLPSKAFAAVGLWSFAALGAAALLAAALVLCFAELGSRFEDTGGPYLYVRSAFGELPGFAVGWLAFVTRPLSAATLLNLLITYAAGYWPPLAEDPWRILALGAIVAALTGVALAGVRQSAWSNNLLTLAKIGVLLAVAVPGVLIGAGLPMPAPAPLEPGAFTQTILLLIFAFVGFESVSIVAGEVRDPRRAFPFAVIAGMGFITALYAALLFACVKLLPGLAGSERPIADAARAMGGEAAYQAVIAGAVPVLLGSVGATILLMPRLLFALAERGQAPRMLAAVHPRRRTPWIAILLSGAVVLLTTLFNDFLSALVFSTTTRILIYIACAAGLLRLRAKRDAPEAAFRVPFGGAVAVLGMIGCVLVLVVGGWTALPQLAGVVVLGFALLAATRLLERRRARHL